MSQPERSLTVSEVARVSGVSVRTLHHYEELGLLQPAARSAAGYRLYSRQDLLRLQEILFYRELGFALEQIRAVLAAPDHERASALREQRGLLVAKIDHLERVLSAIDRALRDAGIDPPVPPAPQARDQKESAMNNDHPPQAPAAPATNEELFEVFGKDVREHEPEVRARWGETESYRESARRTRAYTKEDWAAIKAEDEQLLSELSEALAKGLGPTEEAVLALAERHRLHIDRWFYPCSPAMHAGLGQMYLADTRFTAHYEAVRPGLAAFVAAAWQANAERHGV